MRTARRWAPVGVGAALVVMVTAAAGWACIAGPTLRVTPGDAKPGQQVTLSGFSYKSDMPIVVRWNALDGPVLGTFMPAGGRFGDDEFLNGTVTVPADAKPGSYVLVATQSSPDGALAQVPVRALVTVTGPGGTPAVGSALGQPELGRPVGPARTESSVSTGALVLVAVGVAGVGMFLAGVTAVFMSRRRDEPAAARATR